MVMPYTPAVSSRAGHGGSGALGVAVMTVTLLPGVCGWCYKESTPTDTHQPERFSAGCEGVKRDARRREHLHAGRFRGSGRAVLGVDLRGRGLAGQRVRRDRQRTRGIPPDAAASGDGGCRQVPSRPATSVPSRPPGGTPTRHRAPSRTGPAAATVTARAEKHWQATSLTERRGRRPL